MPVKGAWIVWLVISIPAFMLDLEQITKVISCGNLTTYSFVTACGIALRFRDRETQTTVRASGELYVWAFLVMSFLTALCFMKEASNWITCVFGGLSLLILVRLCLIEQRNRPRRGHYTMPFVPILPAIGIFFNFMLASGLDGVTWGLFGAWLCLGLIVYFCYGMHHSNLEVENVTRGHFEVSLISHNVDEQHHQMTDDDYVAQKYAPDDQTHES